MDDLETIEDKIIECLNEADYKLDATAFSILAESIIDYIDEINKLKTYYNQNHSGVRNESTHHIHPLFTESRC